MYIDIVFLFTYVGLGVLYCIADQIRMHFEKRTILEFMKEEGADEVAEELIAWHDDCLWLEELNDKIRKIIVWPLYLIEDALLKIRVIRITNK